LPKRQNQGECRHGGKRVTRDRRERTSELVTAVRLAVALCELIRDLLHDHLGQGGAHGLSCREYPRPEGRRLLSLLATARGRGAVLMHHPMLALEQCLRPVDRPGLGVPSR
jgi:hypothetical protein